MDLHLWWHCPQHCGWRGRSWRPVVRIASGETARTWMSPAGATYKHAINEKKNKCSDYKHSSFMFIKVNIQNYTNVAKRRQTNSDYELTINELTIDNTGDRTQPCIPPCEQCKSMILVVWLWRRLILLKMRFMIITDVFLILQIICHVIYFSLI